VPFVGSRSSIEKTCTAVCSRLLDAGAFGGVEHRALPPLAHCFRCCQRTLEQTGGAKLR
jgi:hypothetical protein